MENYSLQIRFIGLIQDVAESVANTGFPPRREDDQAKLVSEAFSAFTGSQICGWCEAISAEAGARYHTVFGHVHTLFREGRHAEVKRRSETQACGQCGQKNGWHKMDCSYQ